MHLGMRGQTGNGKTPFAEIMDNNLVLKAPQGWLAVVRPDRVVMHDGPSQLERESACAWNIRPEKRHLPIFIHSSLTEGYLQGKSGKITLTGRIFRSA